MNERHDIEPHLAYSQKLQKLAAGHQQETAQLLEDIEQLNGDIHQLLDENKKLRMANEAKDARIAELEQRVADLEKEKIHVDGNYIEKLNIEKYLAVKPKSKSKSKAKLKYYTPTSQLPLWDSNLA